jgi:ribosomal protein L37AE/L43A
MISEAVEDVKNFIPQCKLCGDTYNEERFRIGYAVCLPCGNDLAKKLNTKRTVVPMNKSNYMMVTDMTILKQLNPKRTT